METSLLESETFVGIAFVCFVLFWIIAVKKPSWVVGGIIAIITLCFIVLLIKNYWQPTLLILIAMIIIIGLAIIFKRKHQEKRKKERLEAKARHYEYCRSCNEYIDSLLSDYAAAPTDFEKYVADVLTWIGYKNVKVTPPVADGGKDITAVRDDNFYVVEVKLYNQDHKISREQIQKLHSAMIDSNADKAIFVTTSDFSSPAEEYAAKHGIEIWNGQKLYDIVNS